MAIAAAGAAPALMQLLASGSLVPRRVAANALIGISLDAPGILAEVMSAGGLEPVLRCLAAGAGQDLQVSAAWLADNLVLEGFSGRGATRHALLGAGSVPALVGMLGGRGGLTRGAHGRSSAHNAVSANAQHSEVGPERGL